MTTTLTGKGEPTVVCEFFLKICMAKAPDAESTAGRPIAKPNKEMNNRRKKIMA